MELDQSVKKRTLIFVAVKKNAFSKRGDWGLILPQKVYTTSVLSYTNNLFIGSIIAGKRRIFCFAAAGLNATRRLKKNFRKGAEKASSARSAEVKILQVCGKFKLTHQKRIKASQIIIIFIEKIGLKIFGKNSRKNPRNCVVRLP